jgi:hypothetical protein
VHSRREYSVCPPNEVGPDMRRDGSEGTPYPPACHSGRDGECNWKHCPQEREGEPDASGRHCPVDTFWSAYCDESGWLSAAHEEDYKALISRK